MKRLTFRDIRASRIPAVLGTCPSDTPGLCSYVNEAQERLIKQGGDTGWYGSWAKMVFNTTRANPYITAPIDVARLINVTVCDKAVRIQNEFFEFLEFGSGLQKPPASCNPGCCGNVTVYDRGMFPTMADLTAGNTLRVYLSNAADEDKRIFFNAIDANNLQIYTLDNGIQVNGFFIMLASPFVDSPMALNAINGIQKDTTLGPVSIYQVNATTGAETLLATLGPNEANPAYRRYFLQGLPCQCQTCDAPAGVVQVTAMAKLDYVPVRSDTDYLTILNIPALKEECQAVRLEEMDSGDAKQQAMFHHKRAIQLLNQELIHFEGKEMPAMQFKPFGNATLERAGIGMI